MDCYDIYIDGGNMRNIKLTIAYDGFGYNGWQRQKNGLGVETVVENACEKLFNQEINIIGCSRTDSGVHAIGQVATFLVDSKIPVEKIPYALNTRLPDDIVINKAEEMPLDFHPRYHGKQKTYQYLIYNDNFMLPQYRNYMEFQYKQLDIDLMKQAAKNFLGTHDFIAFSSKGSSVQSTIRTIHSIDVTKEGKIISIYVTGDGFLYNMVRKIAGTLIDVGKGKRYPQDIINIIESKERKRASKTAPACGLTLVNIEY